MTNNAVKFDSIDFKQYFENKNKSSTNISKTFAYMLKEEGTSQSGLKLLEKVNTIMSLIQNRTDKKDLRHSMLLNYTFFIKNHYFDRLCTKLYNYRKNSKKINETLWRFNDDKLEKGELSLKFQVNSTNENELQYAFYLCDLNEHVVKPWLQMLPKKFGGKLTGSNFNRFFSVQYMNGKSIHDALEIFSVRPHSARMKYNYTSYNENVEFTPVYYSYQCKPPCSGYTAHFRNKASNMDPISNKLYFINIVDIRFDWFFFASIYQISKLY